MSLLAEVWNMPAETAKNLWVTTLITAPNGMPGYTSLAEWFRQVVAPTAQRIYLTFIHTDHEVVLSGDSTEMERLLQQYPFASMSMALNNVVHHDFCRKLKDEFLEMHRLPIEYAADKQYYSSISLAPMVVDSEHLAENATEVCCSEVDFPRLVQKLAADGHNIFVEVGANATCTRMIGEILAGTDHLAIPTDRKGASVLRNLHSMVALLLAHDVHLDLNHFYEPESSRSNKPKELNKTLRTGGSRYETVVHAFEHQNIFAEQTLLKSKNVRVAEPVLAGHDDEWHAPPPPVETPVRAQTQPEKVNMDAMIMDKKGLKAENGLDLQDFNDPDYLRDKTVIWDENDLFDFCHWQNQRCFRSRLRHHRYVQAPCDAAHASVPFGEQGDEA